MALWLAKLRTDRLELALLTGYYIMASSTNNDDPNKSPTQSVGVLDFNRINSASSNQPPSQYKLPVFHFHSYGSDDRTPTPPSPSPVAPGATDFPQGIFYIKSALSGKVLDVPGGSRKVKLFFFLLLHLIQIVFKWE
jgi:hypothetical protein